MLKEIRFTGFGGQGIILAGYITGKAATIFDNLHATFVQSYGPESRGGACSAQLVISERPVAYPNITRPDILVAMSQEAYSKYYSEVKPNGIILIEEDLVTPYLIQGKKPRQDVKFAAIPATRIAEQMGKKVVANMVMLGFFTAVTKAVSTEAMKQAIKTSVPKGTEELNLKAFQKGYEYGIKCLMTKS